MSLVVNHNLMSANTARNLNSHYGRLATSTQRLSSGLRINGAADDAAGLAIRELMRADVAALNQGIRNANDAISMIQVADGALGVIDEKLIRMKELAEQAATGTYDSTQRLMIDSEFQAMASEIDRIANATDFNGIKLLDGSTNLELNASHIITENTSITNISKQYVPMYSQDGTIIEERATINISGNKTIEYYIEDGELFKKTINDLDIEKVIESIETRITASSNGFINPLPTTDPNPQGMFEIINTDFYDILAKINTTGGYFSDRVKNFEYSYVDDIDTFYKKYGAGLQDRPNRYRFFIDMDDDGEVDFIFNKFFKDYVDPDLVKDNFRLSHIHYDSRAPTINVLQERDSSTVIEKVDISQLSDNVTIHFGPMNDYAEDYYDIEKWDCTLKGLGLKDVRIQTQDNAQKALVTINDAIVKKDQARAYYGAMQNRLENTVSNLTIQAENLQASESRISDVDVATEMTNFVRNQILTQSAVAMLSQANTLPQMAMKLIGG